MSSGTVLTVEELANQIINADYDSQRAISVRKQLLARVTEQDLKSSAILRAVFWCSESLHQEHKFYYQIIQHAWQLLAISPTNDSAYPISDKDKRIITHLVGLDAKGDFCPENRRVAVVRTMLKLCAFEALDFCKKWKEMKQFAEDICVAIAAKLTSKEPIPTEESRAIWNVAASLRDSLSSTTRINLLNIAVAEVVKAKISANIKNDRRVNAVVELLCAQFQHNVLEQVARFVVGYTRFSTVQEKLQHLQNDQMSLTATRCRQPRALV